MARKNGCPFSVRNWVIEVMSAASTRENPEWLRVKGLTSMEFSLEAETEDGSSADDIWGEPYITKRNGTITLEGKPVTDAATGARDLGQAQLDYYATLGGIDGDAAIRLADPHGRAMQLDAIVTSNSRGADETSETISWELQLVGETQDLAYVQATAVAVKDGATAASELTIAPGASKKLTVAITPENASNQKFSVASADPNKVRVANVDGLSFELTGIAATATPVNVLVKTMNNALTATVAVTVATA